MSASGIQRARRRESHRQQRAAQLHAENRARIAREREAMAARFKPVPRKKREWPNPEQVLAAALAPIGRDYGGRAQLS
jgi:hypothetical protein